jgi:hypothetical protein
MLGVALLLAAGVLVITGTTTARAQAAKWFICHDTAVAGKYEYPGGANGTAGVAGHADVDNTALTLAPHAATGHGGDFFWRPPGSPSYTYLNHPTIPDGTSVPTWTPGTIPTHSCTATPNPAIALVKSVPSGSWNDDGDGIPEPGETITYQFDVTNTGNVALSAVTVTDSMFSDSDIDCGGPALSENVVGALAVGASATCSAVHTLTQADIDNGSVDNTASASGTDPAGGTVGPVTSQVTVVLAQTPGILIVKTGTPSWVSAVPVLGDTIDYDFEVENTGNVTLIDIFVSDNKVATISCPSGNPIPSLGPGDKETCTGTYQIQQQDLDVCRVDNRADAVGIDGREVVQADFDTESITWPGCGGGGGGTTTTIITTTTISTPTTVAPPEEPTSTTIPTPTTVAPPEEPTSTTIVGPGEPDDELPNTGAPSLLLPIGIGGIGLVLLGLGGLLLVLRREVWWAG